MPTHADTTATFFLHHRISATDGETFAYLVVGEHRAQFGTPVHHCIAQISDSIVHKHVAFCFLIFGIPLVGGKRHVVRACGVGSFGAVGFEVLYKLFDRFSTVGAAVVI